ncbi:MAG: flagellar basal-body MS-ring/collar protein FliF [Myxococcota bacterium]|nr:flagellar basal-body MS-ring/collar protein FliF [Myxococcota bacterium]
MANILDQIKSAYGEMPTSKRIIIGASVALTIALLAFSAWYGSRPEFVSLYPNLGREDTAKVLSELRTKGIPYEVSNTPGGNTMIQVPREKVASLRMQFAERGIPSASVVEGWSIVDKEGFGISESKHRLNKLRALQGELARTIAENQKVVGARVHLAIPDRRTLRLRREDPSASVALRLRPDGKLSKSEVKGISYLVAQSVVGLSADQVSIVDDEGRLLHRPKTSEEDPTESNEKKKLLEREMENNLVRLFEPIVGESRVIANVSIDLDYSRTDVTEESFDPDSQVVRSEQKVSDTRGEQSQMNNQIPGVQANAPGPQAAAQGQAGGPQRNSNSERTTDITNYELSKTVRRTRIPSGTVEKVSVAVVIDGMYTFPQGTFEGPTVKEALKKAAVDLGVAEEDIDYEVVNSGFGGVFGFLQSDAKIEAKATKFGQRDAQEIERYVKLAQSVVGFEPTRGDRVEIIQSPFRTVMAASNVPVQEASWIEESRPYWGLLLFSALSLLALLIFARPVSNYLETASVQVKDLEQQLEQQNIETDGIPLPEQKDPLQLGTPTEQEDNALALVEGHQLEQSLSEDIDLSDDKKTDQALAVAKLEDLSVQDGSIDAKLMNVLEVVGSLDQWDNKLEINRRSALLEKTIRELAKDHPESLAEALTFWMNDRHA